MAGMSADDPRHGTYAGYKAHCRDVERVCDACRAAANEYKLARKRRVPSTRIEDRLEDLRWLVETGENSPGAAKRLGITLTALEKWCRNHAPEEWRKLRSRDRFDELHNYGRNQWNTRQEAS